MSASVAVGNVITNDPTPVARVDVPKSCPSERRGVRPAPAKVGEDTVQNWSGPQQYTPVACSAVNK